MSTVLDYPKNLCIAVARRASGTTVQVFATQCFSLKPCISGQAPAQPLSSSPAPSALGARLGGTLADLSTELRTPSSALVGRFTLGMHRPAMRTTVMFWKQRAGAQSIWAAVRIQWKWTVNLGRCRQLLQELCSVTVNLLFKMHTTFE